MELLNTISVKKKNILHEISLYLVGGVQMYNKWEINWAECIFPFWSNIEATKKKFSPLAKVLQVPPEKSGSENLKGPPFGAEMFLSWNEGLWVSNRPA